VAHLPGNREIAAGAILLVMILLYLVFDLECTLLLGCFFQFPSWLVTFDAVFLALLLLVIAIMLLAAGAVRRARASLPTHIV
jgi:hypothetical protein